TWPDRLERDHGWQPEQITQAQDVVDELRDLLAMEVENAEEENG
ncbi:DUF1441 family protein, partial [Morganella morganii subsp. morganii]